MLSLFYNSIMMLGMIFFMIVIVFLTIKLFDAFGKTPEDPELKKRYSTFNFCSNFKQQNNHEDEQDTINVNLDELSDTEKAILEIKKFIPSFNEIDFINTANKAYSYIIEAHSNYDIDTLKTLLTNDIFEDFKKAIDDFKANNYTLHNNNIRIINSNIDSVKINDTIATIIVNFNSERCCFITDKNNKIVKGDDKTLSQFSETWSFCKNLKDTTSNTWLVSKISQQ